MKGKLISLIGIIFVLLVGISLTGCTIHANVPVVDIDVPPPVIAKKIPLNVAVVVDETENISTNIKPDVIAQFPVGQLMKKASQNVFSHVFEKTTIIKGRYYPPGTAALMLLKIKDFKANEPYGGIFGTRIDITMSINFVLLDTKGTPVWETVVNLSKTKKDRSPFAHYRTVHGPAIAELVVEIFQKVAEEITMSEAIHTYALTKSMPATVVSKEISPPIKSDVDELPTVKAKPNKNAYAIVIGIENYRQKLPKADYAVADAKTMTEYLTKVMGYPEENVVTLTNEHAAKSDFEKYFEKWLFNNAEKDGSVFIYYSGHGAPNPKTSDAYMVPYDGDPTYIEQTGYSLKRLYQALGKLKAKEIVVMLDSCFSGAGGRSVIAKGARPLVINLESPMVMEQNTIVLSAASGDQISSTYEDKGHGLFTYFMLKGLKGEGDTNKDGSIEIGELFGYIKPEVERIARKVYNNEQSPQLIAPKEQKMFLIERAR